MNSSSFSDEIKKINKSASGIFDKIFKRIPENKKPLILVVSAVLLMAVLVFPELKFTKKTSSEEKINGAEIYAEETEKRLCTLISEIDGAGKTKVFLTLESGEENIYAQDINNDKREYVLIKTNSEQGGMLLKILKPEIRGVAVVCEGGNNPVVKMNITNAICCSLGVSSTRISIAKMKGRG